MAESLGKEPGALLKAEDLRVSFRTGKHSTKEVLRGVTWSVRAGEILAIVGESGSGKSVSAQTILGLLPKRSAIMTNGRVFFDGELLEPTHEKSMNTIRGARIALIYQDALSSLNPVQRVGDQIAELFVYHLGLRWGEARRRAVDMLATVSLPNPEQQARRYPHELSGGMRQRVLIAMALALDPDVVIADEPTTALDVTIQAEILELLRAKQQERGLAVVLITHDLGVVANIADRVCVMYAGRVVEEGPTRAVLQSPSHPYTQGLIASVPSLKGSAQLDYIPGQPVDFRDLPPGCAFNPRCRFRSEVCLQIDPQLLQVGTDRKSACHHAEAVLSMGDEGTKAEQAQVGRTNL